MNIAVDIDDTLTDSFAYLQPFVAAYFGADAAELRRQGISYSNLPPAWRAQETAFGKACYDRVVPDIPFKPGAAAAIARLRALGHRIIIITGRTTDFYTDPYRTTAQQLKNGGIVYDALLCTLDKAAACLAQHIDVLIDDLPANCAAVQKVGIRAVLFDSPANRGQGDGLPRVSDWPQAVEALLQPAKAAGAACGN